LEYEFFLFEETPRTVHEKAFRDLRPLTPGNFGYSVLRSAVWSDFQRELLTCCDKMNIGLEGLHSETGPGVLEAAITVDEALASADKAALFKTWTKVVAEKNDLMATFMAKWSPDFPGQSGHLHISLKSIAGEPLFFDADDARNMSEVMRCFVAGCQKYLPELLILSAPTINSFTRLVPGFWAPTSASWGVDNRTCALRAIAGSPKSARLEYRVAGADANPYLTVAAALAAGLEGIALALPLSDPIVGNAYEQYTPPDLELPETLFEGAQKFKASTVAREYLGDDFVDHFAATREWEEREFRKHITDWELKRYFEII
jgi:glutamine synthetase